MNFLKLKRMRYLYTIILLCCISIISKAQTASSYTFSQSSSTFNAISGGTTIFSGSWDDNTSNGLSIGFTFNYRGTNYTTFNINANGWINFGSSTSSSYTPISARTNAIAVLGRDLYRRATSGSGVVSQVTGTSPNRVLTIEWFNVCYYSSSSSGPLNFQIKLYETSNIIEFVYGSFSPSLSTSYFPQVGINGASTSDYNNRTTTSNWSATTAGSSNSATCTSNNSVKPSDGLTFRWCPQTPAITGTAIVCEGATTTLANALNGGTWASSNTAIATVGTSGVVTGVSAGNATISYIPSCGTVATIVVTVNASPATPSGSGTVCTGSAVTYTSSGTGVWTSSNTSVATVGLGTGIVTGVTGGTANISYTLTSGGCSRFATITVNSSPAAITGSDEVCEGSSITLSNATTGGSWSSSVPAMATVGSTGVVMGIAAGSPSISYTLPNGCNSILPITVNPLPATISGSSTVCGSLTTTLTNSSAGGTWSSSSTTIADVDAGTGVVTGGAAGTATITYSLPTGCYTTHGMIVQPLSAITGTPSMCLGFTTALSNATPGGTWSSGNTAIASVDGTGIVSGVALGTAVISYTISSTGCTATVLVAVTNPPTVYAVTGGGAYCADGTGVLVGLSSSDPGVSYQLYLSGAAIGAPLTGTGSAISYGFFLTPGIYTVVANPGTACETTMAGMATITVNSLPPTFAVTGGGNYCSGGLGVNVYLASSTVGVNYQLFNSGSLVGSPVIGTSTVLDFGQQTSAGVYTIVGTDVITGCVDTMTGSASVSIDPLPTSYTVTGGGAYCLGGSGFAVGLSGSETGIQYRLHYGGSPIGTPLSGTAGSLSFGTQTAGGTYTVVATNSTTGCSENMTGSAIITVNSLPTAFTVTGGGNYCSGGSGVIVGLNSSTTGINYQLRRGVTSVGSPVPGTGSPIDFGLQTTAGTYTVIATDASTGCTNNMAGSAIVAILANPTVFSVTGGGNYCAGGAGISVGLSGSSSGVNYSLFNGTSLEGIIPGTGSSVSFGLKTTPGTYSIAATTVATGCTVNMTGTATIGIDPLPDNSFTVTGGGNYCAGGVGSVIDLSGSESGVSYQLKLAGGSSGAAVSGTSASISFGSRTIAGTYTVVGTNTTTSCSSTMTGSVSVGIDPLPTSYLVTGGGSFCAGDAGVYIGLSNSNTGIDYQLYNGGSPVGSVMPGTGMALNMGLQTAAGTYTIVATNITTSCANNMSGSTTVSTLPLPTVHSITGGGGYCIGDAGVHIGIAGSTTGDSYQLTLGGLPVGTPEAGTGGPIDFGLITTGGSYSVIASSSSTGCDNTMGSTTVVVNTLPVVHSVTGGGSYCAGGAGVPVKLASSTLGVNYQLYQGSTAVGSAIPGTGALLDFGSQTAAGTYIVVAEDAATTCTNNMTGSANVTVTPAPVAYTVTGGGNYCTGGTGVSIGLSGSGPATYYQLYLGTTPVGAAVNGTGSPLDFGLQTAAGSYTVLATSYTTSCTGTMAGSANVTAIPLPDAHLLTGGGGYCLGGPGAGIGLDGSDPGVDYQLYNGSSPAGAVVAGTGSAISFGSFTGLGTYTVRATNTLTSCVAIMPGSTNIFIATPPSLYNVTGGGNYCPGAAGVPVGLAGSTAGIDYQLMYGGSPVGAPVTGSGGALDFGTQGATGTYTVMALSSLTSCAANMLGSVAVGLNPAPTDYAVSGGGGYCVGEPGVHIGMANSEMASYYELYNGTTLVGGPIAGTGSALDFGVYAGTGTYSVVANNGFACSAVMSGTANVTQNPLPNVYSFTGGGSYCAGGTGVNIGLGGSETGISYQLYKGVSTMGSPVTGTGTSIDFGLQTLAGGYSVIATNTVTGCSIALPGSANVAILPLPTTFTVSGGGNFCSGGIGLPVLLSGSSIGTTYQLYRGVTMAGAAMFGTGGPLNFGAQSTPGTYTVVATSNTTFCNNTMAGSATINTNPLPTTYSITGSGSYCEGSMGAPIGLDGSSVGVNYRLYRGSTAVGVSVAGTGMPLDLGLHTVAGAYTIVATDAGTTCTITMAGVVNVVMTPQPTAYSVTGGGSYCAGGAGVPVMLSGSDAGVSYELFSGTTPVTTLTGTGGSLDFGLTTATGAYTVVATNTSTSCSNNMAGSATVVVNAVPVAFTVIGGGGYCSGGSGAHLGLSGSAAGINYQLLLGSSLVGLPVSGTGSAIDFGAIPTPGTYTVIATDPATSCSSTMLSDATVSIDALPANYSVTGGGNYCAGGSGVPVGLSNSDAGVVYRLYNGSALIGAPIAGSGSAIDFGLQTMTGTYSVVATDPATGCNANMTGSAVASVNPLPVAYTVVGGGSYCSGGVGLHIGLASSASGHSYQLYNGSTAIGSVMAGTGFAIDLGAQTAAGIYTVVGSNLSTGCTSNMMGSTAITVVPAAAPVVTMSSSAGDTACAGTLVTLTVSATHGGSSPYFEWAVNGALLGTGMSFTYAPADGDNVSVSMTSSETCVFPLVTTAVKAMVVQSTETPVVSVTASPGTNVCEGTTVNYIATPTFGGTMPSYAWMKNGVAVGSSPAFSYMPDNGDEIECVLTSNYHCARSGTATSNKLIMRVDAPIPPTVNITVPSTITAGQSVMLTANITNGGLAPVCEWKVNGVVVAGVTGNTLTRSDLKDGDAITCKVTASSACTGMIGTGSVTIHVSSVGVNDMSALSSNIQLLPNPTKGAFMIKGTMPTAQELSVVITDLLGRTVYREVFTVNNGVINKQVQLSNVVNGMYMVNLQGGNEQLIFHLVVEQ